MDAITETESAFKASLRPRLNQSVWQWAEQNVTLSIRTTSAHGRYDSGWIAYTRGWQDAFSNPTIRNIIICSAAQSGKTEAVLNCLRYAIAEDPGPALWIMPAETLARSFSETRLQPSIQDCDLCRIQIPSDPDQFKLLEMHFRDCTLNLVGANSPAQLSSRPVRYLFADEVDKFPESSSREAGALELAKVRTTTYWNAKVVLTSTPTIEAGQIWQSYLTGSQSKYMVPCPHCGQHQELVFKQVKWPTDERTKKGDKWVGQEVEKCATYECVNCGRVIEQSAKASMVRNGHWEATNSSAPSDTLSFHLNALYSPWRTWGSVAREFLEVKEQVSGLQSFTNSVLAEPWRVLGEEVSEARLIDLRADYPLGSCPKKPHLTFMTADVQRDSVYYVVRAWAAEQESWLVDYGRFPTLTDLKESFERKYSIIGGLDTFSCNRALVDSGYSTQQVYEFCAKSAKRFFPCKGWQSMKQPVSHAVIRFFPGATKIEQSLGLFHFDDGAFKSELYLRRIQDHSGPNWHIASNTGDDYVAQLTRERLVEKKNHRGIIEQVWHVTHRDNHYGDCEKMQLVAAYLVGKNIG